eukprot:gene16065-biopygen5234
MDGRPWGCWAAPQGRPPVRGRGVPAASGRCSFQREQPGGGLPWETVHSDEVGPEGPAGGGSGGVSAGTKARCNGRG